MKPFQVWLTEMANLFPQRKGDTIESSATTHMGFPVYSPTVFWLILNRDRDKYPQGMTAAEIAEELLNRSEKRMELRPGEIEAPDNWKEIIRGSKWTNFLRGLNSMIAKSQDFRVVGKREKIGGKGRAASIYYPTETAIDRQGGLKFLKKQDREFFKDQDKAEKEKAGEEETKEKSPAVDLSKNNGDMTTFLQSLLDS